MAARLQQDRQSLGYGDAVARLVVLGALGLAFLTFRDYGVPWDGQGEAAYGELLIKYYASWFRDHSAFNWINLRYYGGGFELPAALLARVSPFEVHETRHLFCAVLAVIGLAGTWRLARLLGGPLAGLLATLLLLFHPTWYGHAFVNARDIPFASGMVCCLLFSVRILDELPRISWRSQLGFGLAFGLTVSVRVGGVLALIFLGVPLVLWLIGRARSGVGVRVVAGEAWLIALPLLVSFVLAYAVMLVLWPWAQQSVLNPLRALMMFSRFPFEANVLFEGRLVPARALPAAYLPVQFAVRSPEVLLFGLLVAVVVGAVALKGRAAKLLASESLRFAPVIVAAVFPFVYFAVFRPVAYNGMRHFLFVIPPLCVIAALAFQRLLQAPSRVARVAFAAGLALAFVAQARTLIDLHPDEYTYFNLLVGGPRGAAGRFELDYWGISLAEATEKLVDQLDDADALPDPGKPPLKVYVCGNVWSAATFFPESLTPVERVEDADFQIAIDDFFCKRPAGSKRVLEVTRAGATLSYVDDLRRLRAKPGEAGLEQTRAPSVNAPQRRAGLR